MTDLHARATATAEPVSTRTVLDRLGGRRDLVEGTVPPLAA